MTISKLQRIKIFLKRKENPLSEIASRRLLVCARGLACPMSQLLYRNDISNTRISMLISQPLYQNNISSPNYKSQFISSWDTDYKHSLLLNCHQFLAKISIVVDFIAQEAVDIVSISSSSCSGIHILARYVVLKRICKQVYF